MVDQDLFLRALKDADPPTPSIPPDAFDRILRGIRRRRRQRTLGVVVALAAAVPISLGISQAFDSDSSNAPGIAPPEVPSGTSKSTSEPLTQTNDIPADLTSELRGLGYVLEPSSASARAAATITADDAIASAHREYGVSDATGVAVEIQTVTTPDLGPLEDPGDPNSAVTSQYDHQQMWVVAFDVMAPESDGEGPPDTKNEDNDSLVPGTFVVFVDASTGAATRGILF